MSKRDEVKVILRVPVHLLTSAARAFDHAYHNSTFSGGFSVVEVWPDTFVVKKNKAGFSVWRTGA